MKSCMLTAKWLGRITYSEGLTIQQRLITGLKNVQEENIPSALNYLLLLEHYPVYTVGIRSKSVTLSDEMLFQALGAQFYRSNRGGLLTFHGPGQLVAYPIIDLRNWKMSGGVRWFVCNLEDVLIETCRSFNVKATRTENTGVWIGDRKLAALGIHISRHVTSHGIALNCNTNLDWFAITPCGIPNTTATSLTLETGNVVEPLDALPHFLSAFKKFFNCSINLLNGDSALG